MREPRCIRIFPTAKEASLACEILTEGGFECYTTEGKFGDLTLEELQIPPRHRFWVEQIEIDRVAEYLTKQMTKRRT